MALRFLNNLLLQTTLLIAVLGCTERTIERDPILQTDRKMGTQTFDSGRAVSGIGSNEFEGKGSDKPLLSTGGIVFSSNRSGTWRIWSINADGSAMRQLTAGKPDDHDVDPAFSPNGKTILFTSDRGGKIAIWKMSTDGASSPERVCDGDQAEWSPDGARIVFRRNEKIYTRNLTNEKEKRISPIDWPHCSGPAWSPDGKTIAFACRWDADNAIFIVKAAGGKPAKVYDKQGACEPHWSPDGQLLAYETETHICTIRPDGKKNRLITYFGGVQRYPRWSPDGRYLVYCQGVTERGPWELYIIPSKGGTPVKLTEGGSDMNPDWRDPALREPK